MNFNHLIVPKQILRNFQSDIPVIVRFPPEPSGYLHLGHIKALYINACISKHFNGRLIIRFDDTNPSLESAEFESAILSDLTELGIDTTAVTYTSDYFDQMIKYAESLIKKGQAYVDLTDVKLMREMRESGISSVYRDEAPEIALNKWDQMKLGQLTSGVLRLKTNLQSRNKAMRDPTIYRSILCNHHRTGNKYLVYPTYDFACPIVDSLQGVTHVFRSAEYNERNEQADHILTELNLPKPHFYHYGKLGIKDSVLSKRKIKEGIEKGHYTGWDDLRLYTYVSLKRKGLQLPALEEFMKETGYSTVDVVIDPSKLWQINKKYIDTLSTRYIAIDQSYSIYNIEPKQASKSIPRYPKNISLGNRNIYYDSQILISEMIGNEIICPINWGAKDSFEKIGNNLIQTDKKVNKYVPWVTQKFINITVHKPIADELIVEHLIGEEAIKEIKVGDYIQLMQKGYYICEEITSDHIKLIAIC